MEERVAIVTGSSAGIGLAIAKVLAKAGIRVVINGRTLDKLKDAESQVEAMGGRVLSVQADASDEEGVSKITKETLNYFGRLDILVNNAATVGAGNTVENMPIEVWDSVMAVNLRGVFLFCKSAIPHIKEQKSGRIINIGGLSSKNPLPYAAADAASKAGLLALTRVLAAELGPSNITVNAVLPGSQPDTEVGREFLEKMAVALHTTPEVLADGVVARTLMKRNETPEEIAQTVLFLCSEGGAAITGQNLNVNCGLATF